MKTSNKLLIILAAALFVFPVVGMAIYAKNTRINEKEYENGLKNEGANPNEADHFLRSRKVGNFNAVVIDGDGNLYSNISVIKSDKPLIKFSAENENLFTTSIDDSGTLHIKKKSEKNFFTSSIYVFTPYLDSVSLNKLQIAKFETDFDSIKVNANQINNAIRFGENKNLKKLDLAIKNSQIDINSAHNTNYNFSELEDFNLQVFDGKVSLKPSTYKLLRLNLHNSRFYFGQQNNRDKSDTITVENMIVNTLGNSELSLPKKAVEINHINGSLSDSTVTDLPIYIVKGLFEKQQ